MFDRIIRIWPTTSYGGTTLFCNRTTQSFPIVWRVLFLHISILIAGCDSVVIKEDGSIVTRIHRDVAVTDHGTRIILGDGDLTANYRIPIMNWFNEPITIERIITSCACSNAELDNHVLLPHESSTLDITVTLPSRGGVESIRLVLTSRCGKQLVHQLRIEGYPRVQIVPDDGLISLGRIVPDGELTYTQPIFLHTYANDDTTIDILSASSTSELLEVWMDKRNSTTILLGPEDELLRRVLPLNLHVHGSPGQHSATLILNYTHSDGSGTHHVPVTWYSEESLLFHPPRVLINHDAGGSLPLLFSVTLSSTDNTSIHIRSINTRAPWLRIEDWPEGSDISHDLTFAIERRHIESAFTEVEVETDHPLQASTRLPVTFVPARTEQDAKDRL